MREWFKCLWIISILLYAVSAFADEARLSQIAVTADPNTKIVLNVNQTVPYKAFTLPNPSRLVVDLQKTQYGVAKGKNIDLRGTDITDFRHGIQEGYNLRMVFDLKTPLNFNVETSHENGFQIILKLSPSTKNVARISEAQSGKTATQAEALQAELKSEIHSQIAAEKTEKVEKVEKTEAKNNEDDVVIQPVAAVTTEVPLKAEDSQTVDIPLKSSASLKPETSAKPVAPTKKEASIEKTTPSVATVMTPPVKKRKFIVVIDAGHGGKDPGATGPSGTHEKNITLAIAKDLQTLVNNQPGMKAVLTRKGDYYVGLRQRLMIARKAKGDVFIAIHADAYNEPDASGASVFALSLHGSSSEAALWLAQKENYSELSGIDLNGIQDQDTQVRSVLIDLSQTATIAGSLQLGRAVIQQLQKLTELHHGAVEQAPFMVLKSPDIPSILVETGFLTNPKEENRLKTDAYQEKIAKAILNGINEYYGQNVPRNISVATAA